MSSLVSHIATATAAITTASRNPFLRKCVFIFNAWFESVTSNVAEMFPLVTRHQDTKTVSGAMGNQQNHVYTPIAWVSNGN